MRHITDLSNYEIYHLWSAHPAFSEGWQETLSTIMADLNDDSQESIYRIILAPKGIVRTHNGFDYQKPTTAFNIATTNPELQHIIQGMQNITPPPATL